MSITVFTKSFYPSKSRCYQIQTQIQQKISENLSFLSKTCLNTPLIVNDVLNKKCDFFVLCILTFFFFYFFPAATALVLDLPIPLLKTKLQEIATRVNSLGFLGPFHPNFDVNDLFRQELAQILPSDAHIKATGRLHISLTDSTLNNVIVSSYSDLNELKEALICSCFLPGFSSWTQVPTYKNKPYLDGGFSNNQPVQKEFNTLRVSPFSGGSHICPPNGPNENSRPQLKKWGGEVVNITAENFKRLPGIFKPVNLDDLFQQGYDQTEGFLKSEKFKLFLDVVVKEQETEQNSMDDDPIASTSQI